MTEKSNGSGNGHDEDKDKVLKFPTLAERDRIRKAEEEKYRAQYKAARKAQQVPFFNTSKIPPFSGLMIVVFLLVHIPVHVFFDSGQTLQAFYVLGFVSGAFTGTFEFHWYMVLTPFTHMFIHGSWMHLLINSVMTLVLGMFLERELGTRRTAIFFVVCGLAGAAAHFILNPFSTAPVVGASGSVNGFFGAVLVLLSQQRQLAMAARRGPWPIIAFWVAFMIIVGLISGDSIAWQAHIGGFLAGVGLLLGLQKGILRF